MSKKQSDTVTVLDRTSRRGFMRTSGGILLAGASATMAGPTLASDCDQGAAQSSDQDAGESADPKGCQDKNIISQHQPERTKRVIVKTVKG